MDGWMDILVGGRMDGKEMERKDRVGGKEWESV